ncbi:CHAT domain-containing protein [Streptomyces europaeiscabiei]|uniref:CHAT domain-containing protein n=1 Tax=Streptomyces europaeiscabiei TaxID=146819 RepID=UPI0029B5581F|nr:CHAT domain-containing protein [Streptomyces europaeiscabiei]MDX3698099.1 CHAT domain-containing protein [Streptomyces europaeiscabiei]
MFRRRRYTQGKRYDVRVLYRDVELAVQLGVSSQEDLVRIASVILDGLGCATADEAWDRLCADFRVGRRGTLWSGMRAAKILRMMPYLGFAGRLSDEDARIELCEEVLRHGPPAWQANAVLFSASRGMHVGVSSAATLEAELDIVERARGTASVDTPELDLVRTFIRLQLGLLGGEDDFDAAIEELAKLRGSSAVHTEMDPLMGGALADLRVKQALRTGDEGALRSQLAELDAALDVLSLDVPVRLRFEASREMAWEALQVLRVTRGEGRDAEGERSTRPADSVRNQAQAFPAHVRGAVLCETGMARLHRAVATDDPAGAREALSLLGEGLELLEPDDQRWVPYAYQLGWGHSWIAERDGLGGTCRPSSFDRGIDWLTRAVRASGGPEHPLWSGMSFTLARALRARGEAFPHEPSGRADLDAARCMGMEAVDGAVRTVLLQSGTSHAAETARADGQRAVDIAGWCLADDAHTEAVRTLEAGRGLALHAATVWKSVPEMLDTVGKPDLAGEWRTAGAVVSGSPWSAALAAAGTGPSSRLRRRVLEVLEDSPYRERMRDVPAPDRIGGALRTMGRTALVYLLPRTERQPGAALVVTPDGTVQAVRLPALYLDAPELVAYRGPVRVADGPRDAGGAPTEGEVPPPHVPGALGRLCDWAGRAVMEPLLRAVPGPEGQEPSIVLVPMAELGVVPWHAARLPGSARYACQEANISYIPSARLLCEVAERPATEMCQALLVGDPEQNLHHAGEEAGAIGKVFYPGGDLLGPGVATPAAVKDWLGRQRGGVLHLACHGAVQEGGRYSSYLRLADELRLPAEELTEGSARYRGLELVVLAACRSNVSGHGWDEAYSLATAFLVAGARSVVGSLWPVPDGATSLLMYMTHHYLNREGQTPGAALRSAQLWMLDPMRVAPPEMPTAMVRRVAQLRESDLVGWAGFTHLGW